MTDISAKHPGAFELPLPIAHLSGRIVDIDQHEAVPINLWAEEFGAVTRPMTAAFGKTAIDMAEKSRDDAEISVENVFRSKLEKAPGSFDMRRRLEVMDFIGVDKALVYPGTLAMISVLLFNSRGERDFLRDLDVPDRRVYGHQLQRAYNDWCIRAAGISGRLRPVAILQGETPDDLHAEARRLVDAGIRAVWVPSGIPLAGLSPAHSAHDPLWSLLAEADCPVLDHVGGQSGFMATQQWREAPAFEGWTLGGEFSMDPWRLSTQHFAAQNYLTVMILGGVFERHPRLRFGTAELTGGWLGPMAEVMDLWLANKPFRSGSGDRVLSMKPSDYVRRNVRIGCFDFEPIDQYIRRFGFEEVYCYCSDYPHNAGGNDPLGVAACNLEPLGGEVLKKFFVENGDLLLPD